ncbi:MAG: excinuclease ABC subunit UvrC [Acidobacteria bacterium]|nr:excinuclease ABC subunit UvrC [Acidobacteriota bacterium]
MRHPEHWDDLKKIASLMPTSPGVYLYKDAADKVIYVGKAKSLRDRVRSYFLEEKLANAKTNGLLWAARNIESIAVGNEKEALALENNLIKQLQPRFNVLLRDDKTYPYIKLTNERWPRVYVTRRLKKDGASYFGPYFPGNLAHRLVHFIHRWFKIPSCRVDLTRFHPRPCLEFHIQRCLGPCVEGLTTDADYSQAVEDVRKFLDGRRSELTRDLKGRMMEAAENLEFERAAKLRDLLSTVEEMQERQRVASAEGNDVDVFGVYAEPPLACANLFHVRNGRVVDRREFFWEELHGFDISSFLGELLVQIYLDQQYVPSLIHVPEEFEDQDVLAELLSEKRGTKVEIAIPQRGPKKAMLDLVANNCRHAFEQRFRVMAPTAEQMASAWREALNLPAAAEDEELNDRIECFDISHIQGSDVVASMVVWENGRMKKSDYRKFIVHRAEGLGHRGNDDFASMREVVGRRYGRLQREGKPFPALTLIDGGVGQLHAAAEALEEVGVTNQPLAAIAKKEELLYVFGQEDEPIRLDRFSPILRMIQQIRDEAHRFAVTFHRQRRKASRIRSELLDIPGVGEATARKLLKRFGSLKGVRQTDVEALGEVVDRPLAHRIYEFLRTEQHAD